MTEIKVHNSSEFIVRDYECDVQGVVNNANYLNFLEHARHEMLISKGIDFIKLHYEGIDLIVTKAEIEYKYPLRSLDRYVIKTSISREGNIRFAFSQTIIRIPDEKLIVRAKIIGAVVKNGKPVFPGEIIGKLELD